MIAVVVHAANIQDRDGAKLLLGLIQEKFHRLQLIWADGGYRGKLLRWVSALRPTNPLKLEIIKRNDQIKGFQVLPRRWVVERTLGWLAKRRSIATRWCKKSENWLAFVQMACAQVLLKRISG